MASSSSLKHKKDYDIYLSFRGIDVRKNFLSHLYTALKQNGLSTYIDNKEMRKGEEIRLALMKAIEESHFAIIIFSKNYASSQWCLEELVKIKECKVRKDLIVLPVFYKVEPREVKKMLGSYGRAMAKHESKFGKYSQKVTRWRKALSDIGNLCGWHLNDEVEAELIKEIVNKISMQLARRPLHVDKHMVGIHPRVIELNSMLKLEFDDCVRMIGLWGPGGIGKTTLGLALYDNISWQFVGSCFLVDIHKALEGPKDLVALQEQLLYEILKGERLVVSNVHRGMHLMQDRLCRKKVLIVLDNVTEREQLNALAREPEWFGEGSRIIIITRDKHLLTSHGIDEDYIYEVKPLENYDAFELFTTEAFLSRNNIRRDLVNRVLHYANGHPLALTVMGHFLRCRSECEWESTLHNLANIPNKIINDAFKWSYVGLDNDAKQIFLDIACLFTGHSKEYIMKVLDSHDFDPVIGVKVLVEKSLIIEERETLRMCNLIQLMAMDIIRQECPNDPGRRSRLWLFDDFRSVLSRQLVTHDLQLVVLNLPKPEKIYIGAHALTNLRRLRTLIMINVHNYFQDPIYLPGEIKWFEWPECRPWSPESSSSPKKLGQLDLHESNIQALSKQLKKPINFSESPSLVYMPNFAGTYRPSPVRREPARSFGNQPPPAGSAAAGCKELGARTGLPHATHPRLARFLGQTDNSAKSNGECVSHIGQIMSHVDMEPASTVSLSLSELGARTGLPYPTDPCLAPVLGQTDDSAKPNGECLSHNGQITSRVDMVPAPAASVSVSDETASTSIEQFSNSTYASLVDPAQRLLLQAQVNSGYSLINDSAKPNGECLSHNGQIISHVDMVPAPAASVSVSEETASTSIEQFSNSTYASLVDPAQRLLLQAQVNSGYSLINESKFEEVNSIC